MRQFIGRREAIPRVWLSAVGRGLLTETGGEVPINVRKRFGILLPRGCRSYFPRRLRRQVRLSAEASAEARAVYSISETSASRLSLPESPSSVSPAWSKHRRQSPLFTRNAVSHRGHSSDSCVIAGQISEAIVYHWGRQIASQERRVNRYLACSALAASAPQRWRSSSSMSAGFSTVWATSSRNNQR
jgi:hypothetical protein